MAELEVVVNHRPALAKVGLWTMFLTMPVWAIGEPFLLGLFISQLIVSPDALSPLLATLVIAAMLAVPLIAVALSALCEDDRVVVTREGLAFPLYMLPGLKFKRSRMWSELTSASVLRGSDKSNDQLKLGFDNGGATALKLQKLDKSALEQFLLGIEVWAAKCTRSPELIEMQTHLQNEARGIEVSYTQMWEEELSRRFSATSFVPLEPDKTLQDGRLKIVRQLAFGGLSAIYLAQENDKDLVVIKEAVIPASADEQTKAKALELFQREARFLIRLDHPQIAKVYDHFTEDNRNYLKLEYIRGQDLRQFVKQHGAQPESDVLNWAEQIADIVAYLHEQSPPIIHRDLTPDNLVRREDGTVILIDFGAANEFVGTATGTLVGKQAYIAPEQLRGKATTQSDIYALGGTMYFLLCGSDPEPISSSHPKQLKAEVSQDTDALVASCTEMETEDRIATARDVFNKIRSIGTR